MSKEFPWDIKLQDSWFEWEYGKFTEVLSSYRAERKKLEDMEFDATKPIPCKSWVKCYFFGDEPKNLAVMWGEINQYIKDNTKEGWVYSHIETTQVDVNNDPYDDYENLTDQYTVFSYVDKAEDFKECKEYKTQEAVVQKLYEEVMEFKGRIDKKINKEGNDECFIETSDTQLLGRKLITSYLQKHSN